LAAAALSAAGRYSMLWLAAAGLGWAFAKDHIGFAWFLAAILMEWVLTNAPVKLLFNRQRPDNSTVVELIPGWLHPPRSSSFPSGHSSAAAFSTVIWWAWNPAAGIVCAVFAVAMGLSRLVLKAHHPSDVAAGFAWGAALAGICLAVARDLFPS
jgi:membrane-associated phospholipid phosphatase